MHLRSPLIAIATLCLGTIPNAVADDCLRLNEALYLSAQIDPAIGEASARKAGADARLSGVKAQSYPQISGFAQTNDGPNGIGDGRTNNQIGISVSQRLYDFGRTKFQRHSAKARVEAAKFTFDQAENEVATITARSYLDGLRAAERVSAAKARRTHLSKVMAGVEKRLAAKDITRAEASRIEAEFALADADLIEEELARAAAQSDVFILTSSDLPVCQDLDQVDAFFAANLPETLVELIDIAVMEHPEILAMEAERAALQADVKVAARNRAPAIDLEGVAAIANENFSGALDPESRIGLNVSTPLYGFGRYRAQSQEAKAELQAVELSAARLRRDLEKQVTLTWQRANAYESLALAQTRAREKLQAEATALQREFENGLRPYQDILQAEAGVQTAILNEIEARYLAREQSLLMLNFIDAISP